MIHKTLFALISINFFFVSHAMQKRVRFQDSPAAQSKLMPLAKARPTQSSQLQTTTIFIENLVPDKVLVRWVKDNQEDSRSLVKNHSKKIDNLELLQELDITPYGRIKGLLGAEVLTLGFLKPENLVSRIRGEVERIRREQGDSSTFIVTVELQNKHWWNSYLGQFLPYVVKVRKGTPNKSIVRLWDAFPRVKEFIDANQIEFPIPGEGKSVTAQKIAKDLRILKNLEPRYFLDLPEGVSHAQIDRAFRALTEEWQLEACGGDAQMQDLTQKALKFINGAYQCLTWGRKINKNSLSAMVLAEIFNPGIEIFNPGIYDIKKA